MRLIFVSLTATTLFILLDIVWFYFASGFFKSEIGSIARLTPAGDWNIRIAPALMVYVLMGIGVTAFVYLNATSILSAVLLGSLFGLVGYGLYDLTNLATLSDWTWRFAIVDMLWGAFLCGVVSGAVYLGAKIFF